MNFSLKKVDPILPTQISLVIYEMDHFIGSAYGPKPQSPSAWFYLFIFYIIFK